jgi:hypothetical protein
VSSDISFHAFSIDVSQGVFKIIEQAVFVLCGGVIESENLGSGDLISHPI